MKRAIFITIYVSVFVMFAVFAFADPISSKANKNLESLTFDSSGNLQVAAPTSTPTATPTP